MQQTASRVAAALTWTGRRFERNVVVGVSAEGVITEVLRGGAEKSKVEDEAMPVRRLERQALLPGFVNCHSHAFQRGLRGRGEDYERRVSSDGGNDGEARPSFWSWREEMYRLVGSMDEDRCYELTRQCFDEMRASGITTVGEFHYLHHGDAHFDLDAVVLRAAEDAGLRLVLLQALYLHGGFGEDGNGNGKGKGKRTALSESQQRFGGGTATQFWQQMDRLEHLTSASPLQSLGVVAHSIRACSPEETAELYAEAWRRGLPFHMHVEEQPREVEECRAAHDGRSPMELITTLLPAAVEKVAAASASRAAGGGGGAVDEPLSLFTAVHCNHTVPSELAHFRSLGGTVCVCPLTEGSLGDGGFFFSFLLLLFSHLLCSLFPVTVPSPLFASSLPSPLGCSSSILFSS